MNKRKQIVLIEWVDAAIHGSDTFSKEEAENCKLIRGLAAGILIKENREFVTIAMDNFPEENSFRTVQTYPKSGIKKLTRVYI